MAKKTRTQENSDTHSTKHKQLRGTNNFEGQAHLGEKCLSEFEFVADTVKKYLPVLGAG